MVKCDQLCDFVTPNNKQWISHIEFDQKSLTTKIDIYTYLTPLGLRVRPYTNWCEMINIWSKKHEKHENIVQNEDISKIIDWTLSVQRCSERTKAVFTS